MAVASTRVAALSSLLDAEDGLLCRSILRGLLTAAARRGSSGAGLLLPTDLICLQSHTASRLRLCGAYVPHARAGPPPEEAQ